MFCFCKYDAVEKLLLNWEASKLYYLQVRE